ncbi:hypothetical protein EG19_03850 [Thermoanaerobaculum aquaticum]|uniref:Uncharacterized protein n=1 Tax=Thermoanaerobaculum aquaticum TaxID=1312852 RepID=A0A062Y3H1_9BACT|nr:hypothetical protein EG19_03850 [Thermoanaerobaculum aquaticum]
MRFFGVAGLLAPDHPVSSPSQDASFHRTPQWLFELPSPVTVAGAAPDLHRLPSNHPGCGPMLANKKRAAKARFF